MQARLNNYSRRGFCCSLRNWPVLCDRVSRVRGASGETKGDRKATAKAFATPKLAADALIGADEQFGPVSCAEGDYRAGERRSVETAEKYRQGKGCHKFTAVAKEKTR